MQDVKDKPVIELRGVARDFFDGKKLRRVLQKTDLSIYPGEFSIISGPSGSGKTTLLTIMALILSPSEGSVLVQGQDITGSSEDSLAALRLRYTALSSRTLRSYLLLQLWITY